MSMATGGLVLLLFLLNMLLGIPFGASIHSSVHIVVIVASALLVYLGWNAFRDLR
jgi:threonine/homoserine/homoserine lactone efflux protein